MADMNGTSRNHVDNDPMTKKSKGWTVPTSNESKGAVNSIRQCEERHFKDSLEKRDKTKDLIKLSIGKTEVYYYNYISQLYVWQRALQ